MPSYHHQRTATLLEPKQRHAMDELLGRGLNHSNATHVQKGSPQQVGAKALAALASSANALPNIYFCHPRISKVFATTTGVAKQNDVP